MFNNSFRTKAFGLSLTYALITGLSNPVNAEKISVRAYTTIKVKHDNFKNWRTIKKVEKMEIKGKKLQALIQSINFFSKKINDYFSALAYKTLKDQLLDAENYKNSPDLDRLSRAQNLKKTLENQDLITKEKVAAVNLNQRKMAELAVVINSYYQTTEFVKNQALMKERYGISKVPTEINTLSPQFKNYQDALKENLPVSIKTKITQFENLKQESILLVHALPKDFERKKLRNDSDSLTKIISLNPAHLKLLEIAELKVKIEDYDNSPSIKKTRDELFRATEQLRLYTTAKN